MKSTYRTEAIAGGDDAWDADVRKLGGTLFHTTAWRRVIDPEGSESDYFRVVDPATGNAVALVPFGTELNRLGLRLTPLPTADNQTILVATGNAPPDLLNRIVNLGIRTARSRRADFLQLVFANGQIRDQARRQLRLSTSTSVGSMVLDLEAIPPRHLWDQIFNKHGNQRKYISRFKKEGFTIREATNETDLNTFYYYYDENMRSIGAVPFPRDHFERLQVELPTGTVRITLLARGDETAGGLLTLSDPVNRVVYLRYLALNRAFTNHYHPPYALYWEAIEDAARKNAATVDFGLTPDNESHPNFRLKRRFGCVFKPQPSILAPTSVNGMLTGIRHYLRKRFTTIQHQASTHASRQPPDVDRNHR